MPVAPRTNFGIEAWVKPATDDQTGRVIVNYGGDAGVGIEQQKDGVWGVIYGRGTVGFGSLPTDRWTHVALVVNGGRTTLLINGKAAGTTELEPWGANRKSGMGVGVRPDGQKGRFTGLIDEVRVFTFEPGTFASGDLLYFQDAALAALPTYEASLVFDRQPIEKGLTFDRDGTRFVPAVGKPGKPAWAVMESRMPEMPWMRSLRLNFTDERFRNGQMPVVDIEIEFSLDTWGGIAAHADRADGSGYVGMEWGATPSWKTARFRLEDGYFGARDHNSPGNQLHSDGYDLRVFAPNAPLHVRAVRVRGYPLEGDPKTLAWSRLIKVQRARATESPVLTFTPTTSNSISFEAKNLARISADLEYQFQLRNPAGEVLTESSGSWVIDPESTGPLTIDFDSTGWSYGPYTYHLVLEHAVVKEPVSSLAKLDGRLAIYDGEPVPKAKPGEFLYGIQHTKDLEGEIDQAWFAFMGSDFVRGLPGHGRQDVMSRFDAAVPTLAEQGMTLLAMIDPPKPGSPIEYDADGMDAKKREKQLAKLEAFLEELASKHREHLTYFELGNEPDLKFFYPGPVEEYVDSFRRMRAAIKRGNPDAVVMTGGLCFFGEEGDRRARKIIELLSPDGVDAWAFHGHGPGYEAERDAYERQVAAVEPFGGGGLPYIETESGFGAKGESQILEQARTAIEKFVYAQRVGMPKMAWFALHFKDGTAYTTVEHKREPRPAAIAYRTVVQRLRHHRFVGFQEFAQGRVLGHVFHDPDRNLAALVMWSREPGTDSIRLELGAEVSELVGPVTAYDMWNNPTEVALDAHGVAELAVDEDAVFVAWQLRPGAIPDVAEQNPLLLVEGVSVYPGSASSPAVTAQLFNAAEVPADYVITGRVVEADRVLPFTSQTVALESGESASVTLTGPSAPVSATICWPGLWRAFLNVETTVADFESLPSGMVPERVSGRHGHWLAAVDGHVDLQRISALSGEKTPAVLFSTVWSPVDQTVRVGAAADWWMRWSVNGEPVYDTMRGGNGGAQVPTTHLFDLPLRAGHNRLAVEVFSGSQGWSLVSAGPSVIDAMMNPESPARRVEIKLEADGQTIANVIRPLPLSLVAMPIEAGAIPNDWNAWRNRQPLITIGEPALKNPYLVQPDERKWWQGEDDLSAQVWARTDAKRLWLVLAVRDQDHVQQGDGVEVSITPAAAASLESARETLSLDTRSGSSSLAAADRPGFESHRDTATDTTWYLIPVARAELVGGGDTSSFEVALTVNDDDGFGPKQRLVMSRLGGGPLTLPSP
ncbi:MAG: LamG-like jellyroll fold domain-containing protein [Planctomycetota bacterium]